MHPHHQKRLGFLPRVAIFVSFAFPRGTDFDTVNTPKYTIISNPQALDLLDFVWCFGKPLSNH
jgi:hypothetical protein